MINEIQKSAESKMQKSLEALKNNLAKVRTGRAHTGLLDQVSVDYYGSPVPISQVANICSFKYSTPLIHEGLLMKVTGLLNCILSSGYPVYKHIDIPFSTCW